MNEIRLDAIDRQPVIIANERVNRPNQFRATGEVENGIRCPFCAGAEQETPAEVWRQDAPDSSSWSVRIVPNKYPALLYPESAQALTAHQEQAHLKPRQPALGVHEVVIESPTHQRSYAELSAPQQRNVVQAYQSRLAALRQGRTWKYATLFKNAGPRAGASLEHVHSQVIALPWIPPRIARQIREIRKSRIGSKACPWCREAGEAERQQLQLDCSDEHFRAYCPAASSFPYQVRIVPREHQPHFDQLQVASAANLARLLNSITSLHEKLAGAIAYNYLIHTSPFDRIAADHYHWHIDLFPRVTTVAGFEWSTGVFINPVAPEDAARILNELSR